MAEQLSIRLKELAELMSYMGELARRCVKAVLLAYKEGGAIRAQIRVWSDELKALQSKVEDICVELLARYQPVASDLRAIKSYMKIAYDFHRFGRYAWDIAILLDIFPKTYRCHDSVIDDMIKRVTEIIEVTLEALNKKDVKLAEKVDEKDSELDKIHNTYLHDLVNKGAMRPECLILNTLFARYLERIADHACYIAESVIYMVAG